MSSRCEQPFHDTIQDYADQLADALNRVDRNDLSGLAKMHGWCEALAEAVSSETEGEPLRERTGLMAGILESLILGEVEDADQALKQLSQEVSALCDQVHALTAIGTESTSSASEEEPTQHNSDANPPSEPAAVEASQAAQPTEIKDAAPAPESDEPTATEPVEPEPIQERTLEAIERERAAETPSADQNIADETSQPEQAAAYVSEPLTIDPEELEFVKGFVEEAGEHIEGIEAAVLEVEQATDDTSKIDDLFRPFHTIKGMAGFLNLRDVNSLTHEAETLLDQGRKGQRPITTALIDLIFQVVDILKVQVSEISAYLDNPNGDTVPQPPVSEMIGRLRSVIAGTETDADASAAGAADIAQAALVEPAERDGATEAGTPQSNPAGSPVSAAGPTAARGATRTQSTGDRSVRIDTAKLDALVEMVGELVIAQTLVNASSEVDSDATLSKNVGHVTKIVRDVQEVAMGMRMVPIGPTFQKMARLVRDVSRKAGKRVELKISGEDTELDKNVIEQIGDPLVHMVRNAVDHGVERPEARRAAGKPEVGVVHLRASHQGGNIVIEIEDDGKGMDAQALLKKAIEKGIVQPNEDLSEQQAYGLIFAPGFSMAVEVTDISGRGVGMDVVKRNIDHLRGTVDITSKLGEGSRFVIRLPLTLAIIDGMVVRVGQQRIIIPTITIEQSLRPTREQITTVQRRGEVLNVRGKLIALVQLGQLFGFSGRVDPCDTMVVIVQCDGRSIGLTVEELIGQQQVVIKSLGEQFEKLRGVSGAAILGDGRVGLILEPSGVLALHNACATTGMIDDPPARVAENRLTEAPDGVEACADSPTDLNESQDAVTALEEQP